MKTALIGLIRIYQASLSHIFGRCCRFYPSCSDYCLQAITKHGAFRGGALGMKRVFRCRPFNGGGFDPVPEVE